MAEENNGINIPSNIYTPPPLQNNETGLKKKVHPLGALIKVKVHALSSTEKKSQIFCSINKWNFEFQQNVEIDLPKGVVRFLQGATKVVHTADENNKAFAKNDPLYAVSVIL